MLDWNSEKSNQLKLVLKKIEDGSGKSENKAGEIQTENVSGCEDSDVEIDIPGESEEDDIRGTKRRQRAPTVNENTDSTSFNGVLTSSFQTQRNLDR